MSGKRQKGKFDLALAKLYSKLAEEARKSFAVQGTVTHGAGLYWSGRVEAFKEAAAMVEGFME